jgi:cell division initiation protein
MAITPLDIRKKTFATQRHGLSKTEVAEFVEEVAAEMEALRKERAQLTEKVESLAKRIEAYEKTEQLLKDTLVTAQKATNQLREEAKKEAQLVIDKAKLEGERIKRDAEQQIRNVGDELRALEAKRTTLSDEIAGIARTYLTMAERIRDRKPNAEAADSTKRPGDKN